MNKELQDHVWKHCLPKEFKEEVKYEYRRVATKATKDNYDLGFMHAHEGMFGHHNLTSDAEGEDEMLTVSQKRVQGLYTLYQTYKQEERPIIEDGFYDGEMNALKMFFGSKSLPDDSSKLQASCRQVNVDSIHDNVDSLSQNPTENCDNESHISTDCDKPAEPKFKVGDYARYKGDVHKVVATTKDNRCYLNKILGSIDESDLEPYTEPTDFGKEVNFPTKKQSRNLSQEIKNCDKQFGDILKGSFLKERRLNIAAQIARTLIQGVNFLYSWSDDEIKGVAHNSIRIADALIAEVEIE